MDLKTVLKSSPQTLLDLALYQSNNFTFRIPVYQRQYDWGRKNLKRLFEDVSNSFHSLNYDEDVLCFLGTIILSSSPSNVEEEFEGMTLDIVDGQQRLTSLFLCMVSLHEELRRTYRTLTPEEQSSSSLRPAFNSVLKDLRKIFFFDLQTSDGSKPFPRLCRQENDKRSKNKVNNDLTSKIASLILDYHKHLNKEKDDFKPSIASSACLSNYDTCSNFFSEEINEVIFQDFNLECLKRRSYRKLLPEYKDSPEQLDITIRNLKERNIIQEKRLLKLITVARFFLSRVCLNSVVATKEKFAFEIFDSLNTTGEPLTAIQTLLPKVIEHIQTDGNFHYVGSQIQTHFNSINKYIYSETTNSKRLKKAAKLCITFSSVLDGIKLSENSDEQRRHIRHTFLSSAKQGKAREYVKTLCGVAEFMEKVWYGRVEGQFTLVTRPEVGQRARFQLQYLIDLKMTMVIPALYRYYEKYRTNDEDSLAEILNILTTYVVLRRSITKDTADIDNRMREILIGKRIQNRTGKILAELQPVCAGYEFANELPGPNDLKVFLRKSLENDKKVKFAGKEDWVLRASENHIYSVSKPTAKYLLLSAMTSSKIDRSNPILLKKAQGDYSNNYMSLAYWKAEATESLEHIAPQNPKPNSDWGEKIYLNPSNVDKIGNLVCITMFSNNAVSNSNWAKKKFVFEGLAAELDELPTVLSKAEKAGQKISTGVAKELQAAGKRLPLLKGICSNKCWTMSEIDTRGKNVCERFWDNNSTILGF